MLPISIISKDSGRVYQNLTKETATTTSSVAAENNCFVELLEQAKEDLTDVGIATVTTDANSSIRAYMRKDRSEVKHCLDIWHICKNLGKNLIRKATRKVIIHYNVYNVYTRLSIRVAGFVHQSVPLEN